MECKITGITKFYCDGKLVGATNYNGNAFANPHMEITEEDIAMGYKDAGDEIVRHGAILINISSSIPKYGKH